MIDEAKKNHSQTKKSKDPTSRKFIGQVTPMRLQQVSKSSSPKTPKSRKFIGQVQPLPSPKSARFKPKSKKRRTSTKYLGSASQTDSLNVSSLQLAESQTGSQSQSPLFLERGNNTDNSFILETEAFELLGSILQNKYELDEILGRGGMGVVYLARHRILNTKRAIKLLPKTSGQDERTIKRFIQEAQSAARVDHPNVVRVYDIDQNANFYYIVMEYVEGHNLEKHLEQNPDLSHQELIRLMKEAARGVRAIHQAKLIHRDIKPGNILISKQGQVKIADFGIVKNLQKEQQLTGGHSVMGTMKFISPEQIQRASLDYRSDIYSLGATFYFLATQQDYVDGTIAEMIHDILKTPPIAPIKISDRVDQQVNEFILKMLEKDPDKRYQSLEEVIAVLESWSF